MFESLFFAPFKLTGGKPVNIPGANKIIFLTLHRVTDGVRKNPVFNEFLHISVERLEALILHLKTLDAVFLPGDRLEGGEDDNRLRVHLTLDDGYKDNLINALPLFEKHNIPFTLFLTTGIPDRVAVLWWYLLEEIFDKGQHLKISQFNIDINTARLDKEKQGEAFEFLQSFFLENYAAFKEMIDEALVKTGTDCKAFLDENGLDWNEVRTLHANPLCTIGNHTHHHFCMSKLSRQQAAEEIETAQQRIIAETGTSPRALAFPFGAKDDIIDLNKLEGLKIPYAFSTETGIIRDFDKVNRFSIPRYFLSDHVTPFSLNMMINGLQHRVNKLLS